MQDNTHRIRNPQFEADALTIAPAVSRRHESTDGLKASIRSHQVRVDAARDRGELIVGEPLLGRTPDLHPGFASTPRGIRLGALHDLNINLSVSTKHPDYSNDESL